MISRGSSFFFGLMDLGVVGAFIYGAININVPDAAHIFIGGSLLFLLFAVWSFYRAFSGVKEQKETVSNLESSIASMGEGSQETIENSIEDK